MDQHEQYHYYDGVLFPTDYFPATALDAVKSFKVREDDLYVVTYPKSGTTWTQQIVSLIRGRNDMEATDNIPVIKRVPFLEYADNKSPPKYQILSETDSPRYIKSHLPRKLLPTALFDVKPKVIYVARNPKDVLISYYEFKIHPWEWGEYMDNFLKGNVIHGCWFENISYWWQHRHDDNVLFLHYEEMMKDQKAHIRKICHFLNESVDEETVDEIHRRSTFDNMKKNPKANFKLDDAGERTIMRQGKVGSWKERLTAEESKSIDEAFRSRLQEIGFEPVYEIDQ
ncbi:amine sulfotransferase-like [Ptychodera flava]|uniref:amine sulfotransferase-like n=1 Tax=Ptychodera flava TaxID=63121 RepID=UPI00396A5A75